MPNLYDPPAGSAAPWSGFANATRRPTVARTQTFLSSGAWTCPAGVYWISLEACGGGGGGGGSNGSSIQQIAANGGGSAVGITGAVPVVPGVVYTMSVGALGAGGTGGAWDQSNATSGANGGTTSVVGSDGILKLYVPGGNGGTRVTRDENPQPAAAAAPIATDFVNRLGVTYVNGAIGGRGGNSLVLSTTVAASTVEAVPAGAVSTAGVYPTRGSGPGASSVFGRGADNVVISGGTGVNGIAATEFGAGGSGGAGGFVASGGTSASGGNGGPGFIRIQWEE